MSLSEKSSIKEVQDIGDVVSDDNLDQSIDRVNVVEGEITGCEEYVSCKSCKAKVIKLSTNIGECTKCNMKIKLSKCTKSIAARFIIEDEGGNEYKVTTFSEIVNTIISHVAEGNDIAEKLLCAPTMTFTISKKEIVSSISS